MKQSVTVRTITVGVSLDHSVDAKELARRVSLAETFLTRAKKRLEQEDVVKQVQTLRVSFNPIEEYVDFSMGAPHVLQRVKEIVKVLENQDFVSLGPIKDPANLSMVVPIIECGDMANLSVDLERMSFDDLLVLAETFKTLSVKTESGNFRFCVGSRLKPSTPFFPGSYFPSGLSTDDFKLRFAIGLESSDLIDEAFQNLEDLANKQEILSKAEQQLTDIHAHCLGKLQKVCEELEGACFDGVDASMNPSLEKDGIGGPFKRVLSLISESDSSFGSTGSLALSQLITRSIRQAAVDANATLCGYSGLMLPVCEDRGLAAASMEPGNNTFSIRDLLLCSSVCGVGIDTVPIAGNVSTEKLALLMLDMKSLSCQWNKPLSCRVLPVPGKAAGEITDFHSPYLCNGKIFDIC